MIVLIVILVVLALIILWAVGVYNNLIRLRKMAEKSLQDVDIQLQQRFDLIPNLVNTVKGYMKHENETLTELTKYRSAYDKAGSVDEKAEVAKQFEASVTKLFVSVEAYPELKANENFLSLQNDLKETEAKVAYSRQFYNDAATRYNLVTATVPSNIIANMFKFEELKLFEVTSEEAKESVKVDFNN